MIRCAPLVAAVFALLSACGPVAGGPAGGGELVVFGAASLRPALTELASAYEDERPGARLTLATDSSAALATQIEQGAPADVLLSADLTSPRRLMDAGLAVGSPVVYARNGLTIVVPTGNSAAIASPADLGRPGVRLIAAGHEVPITRYADEAIDRLAGLPGYPADFAAACAANVVSREDNVRAVVAKIELGEGDAAIVYATDARASERLETVPIPAAAGVPAVYGGVAMMGPDEAAALDFLAWLTGSEAQAILRRFGFLPPS